jgi:hypothetical protein
MNEKKRRYFSGAFLPQDRGGGAWQLQGAVAHAVDVFLLGAEPGAARAFGTTTVEDLCVEWHAETALLSFKSGSRGATVVAASAIVHEPQAHLYDSLSLVKFDASARRFWRRVFRLVRIPGGRYLLKFLTRASRP